MSKCLLPILLFLKGWSGQCFTLASATSLELVLATRLCYIQVFASQTHTCKAWPIVCCQLIRYVHLVTSQLATSWLTSNVSGCYSQKALLAAAWLDSSFGPLFPLEHSG